MTQQNSSSGVKVADQFPNEDCYSIQEVGKEIGVGVQRVRQLIAKALDLRLIQNLTKKSGAKLLYAPPMVEALKNAYETGKLGNARKRNPYSKSALTKAALVIEVPIFDSDAAKILIGKHGSKENLVEFLRTKLDDSYKPTLSKLAELEERFAKERERLLSSSSDGVQDSLNFGK